MCKKNRLINSSLRPQPFGILGWQAGGGSLQPLLLFVEVVAVGQITCGDMKVLIRSSSKYVHIPALSLLHS